MKYLTSMFLLALLGACGDKSASVAPTDAVMAAAAQEQVRGFVFTEWSYDIPKENPWRMPRRHEHHR